MHKTFRKHGLTAGYADIAHRRKVAASAYCWAIHRGDDGHVEALYRPRNTLNALPVRLGLIEGVATEHTCAITHIFDIATGTKRRALASKHHCTNAHVIVNLCTDLNKVVKLFRSSERVARVRAGHGECQYVVL